MKLFEFESKKILQKYGIAIPRGHVATNPDQAETIAKELGRPVVLKSQVLVSGRGKAGGILFADNAAEARRIASNLIGSTIKGSVVDSLLVEEKLDIQQQFYASVTIDRQSRRYIVLASSSGGVDIEEVARATPDKVLRHWIDPEVGFGEETATEMVRRISDVDKGAVSKFTSLIVTLHKVTMEYDAELVELNPLARTRTGELVAADARMIIDDNALFRHPEFEGRSQQRIEDTAREAEARRYNLSYVDLSGDIGIIGNGAGLVMATMDLVHHFGGRAANFLDIGGGAQTETIKRGLMTVMSKPEVRAVLVNILGGITRCDVVAEGIVQGLVEAEIKKPIAVRLMGTNEEEGARILRRAGIHVYPDMETAAREVLRL
ncbi:MAG: ADP-forming succinate--CoA ligase subunit beta [Chloroflexi bacterium]|nr:ADP-forming succinate--CoA ligase subunit beta [Chloroflexota bacterium]